VPEEEEKLKVGDVVDIIVYYLDCAGLMLGWTKDPKEVEEYFNLVHVYRNAKILDLKEVDGDLKVIFKHDDKIYDAYMGMWGSSLKRIYPEKRVIFSERERARPSEW